MTDLSIASFTPPALHAPRERATDTAPANWERGTSGSFKEMEERLGQGGNARPDQRKGNATPPGADPATAGSGGQWKPRDVSSTAPKEARPATGQAMPLADTTKSDPLALLIDLSVPIRPQVDDRRNGQAPEQASAEVTDLFLASQIPAASVAPPDRTAGSTHVDGEQGPVAVGDDRAEQFEKSGTKSDPTAERLVLSAREIMIALAGGRRERLEAGPVEPNDKGQPADQEATSATPSKNDPASQLLGVAAMPLPAVEPQRVAPSPAPAHQPLSSTASSPEAPLSTDARNPATTKPIDQAPREGHRQGREASVPVGGPTSETGLKASEIVDVESASHFAPAGSAIQQVATAVRENLGPNLGPNPGPATSAPVARLEAVATREATPPLQVLNLKLQPESLGDVAVHMRLSGETLSMHIKVSDAVTLASFQSGSNKLEDLLKASGYQVDKLTIVAAAPPSAADQAPSGDAGARRDGNPSTMTPSGEQSQERSGQAQDGHRGGERQSGFQGGFKGNGGQSHEAPAPRTPRAGVYL